VSSFFPAHSAHSPAATAVILAAGLGSRLRGTHDGPKGLLHVGGRPLVQRSFAALRGAGVADVVLVTGYRAEDYHAFLAASAPHVRTRHNPDFARTGSLHSLWLARDAVPGDLLLLESDLLFEPRALTALLAAPRGNHVLLSGATGQGDEVFAYGAGGRLRELSKERRADETAAGEFTGLTRLTREFFAALCSRYGERVAVPSNVHYEDGLTALAATHPVELLLMPDLRWAEIDDAAQHARALREVLPALPSPAHAGAA
jgi:choline kinase